MTRKVLVIGLGLIGGSISLALQKAPETKIIGFDMDAKTREHAKTLNIVHDIVTDPKEVAADVDVIIFGTPVNATLEWMEQLKTWPLKNKVIVTDTGSTKKMIMQKAGELRELGITFIGGHPMAGSHKSGVLAAKAHLFENAYYMLTPLAGEEIVHMAQLESLLKFTHAKVVSVSAREHDHMTAVVSHFPHVVAASLVHQLGGENGEYPMTRSLAAGGFRDVTRIASSNPILWRDITLQNRDELIAQLEGWESEMNRVKELLLNGGSDDIENYFAVAKELRDELPISAGAMFTSFDLYVDVPDYPGVISEVTGLLADEEISITNLRIVESREDVFGILVISLQSESDRERAATCIQKRANYETYIS
ncbi:prephenate dehydrogenase [Lysinibacillus agricola]|uniref:Prephenate dehydrogenase n=1 Tax=Lysinibacillus agricola TaxID=2590012 RepID=A0ABX7AYW3_9BACI|nr:MULTISPECIES: prephenate dehydrogenase [Lysinibacillus]KOS63628.1 prephenate dehydrogenase [Lysinibacillus sp. FJAT-14222]QQP14043.1 prephenate dehydrogenase [Lysinibacillus agricola]